MFTHGGEGPSLRRSINGKRTSEIRGKKLFARQTNNQAGEPYIRSGADTPISDSVRPSATRAAVASFRRAFVSGASSVTTRHRS